MEPTDTAPGRPLIFIHGAALNGQMWRPQLDRFGARHPIATPDLPGHGSRSGERFSLDAAVETVASAAARIGGKPAVVVGDSLGGYVGMAYAARHPEAVAALLVGGATVNFTGLVPLRAAASGWIVRLLGRWMGQERLVARSVPRLKRAFPDAPMDAIVAGKINFAARDAAIRELSGRDFLALAKGLRTPTLFVNGEHDRLARRQEAAFVAAVAGSRAVVFPGVGHGVSLLRPKEFGDLVAELAGPDRG